MIWDHDNNLCFSTRLKTNQSRNFKSKIASAIAEMKSRDGCDIGILSDKSWDLIFKKKEVFKFRNLIIDSYVFHPQSRTWLTSSAPWNTCVLDVFMNNEAMNHLNASCTMQNHGATAWRLRYSFPHPTAGPSSSSCNVLLFPLSFSIEMDHARRITNLPKRFVLARTRLRIHAIWKGWGCQLKVGQTQTETNK